jgi:hypothetical protein
MTITAVIEKRSLPLFHGKEYSSDSEGDGPGLDKATFLEVWPFVSMWIKQNKRADSLRLANAWGRECDEQLLLKAFARLIMWKYRESDDDGPQFDQDGVENPYQGWDDYQPSYPRVALDLRVEFNNRQDMILPTDDQYSASEDEDAELELVLENWPDYFQRGYGPLPPGYEPPSNLQHGREYSSDEDGDGPSLNKITFLQAWPFIATWIKQNRRWGNLRVAYAMCRAQDMHLMQVAFIRLDNERYSERDEEVSDPEDLG